MTPKRFRNTFVEGGFLWLWLWKLEQRRGQTLPGTLLFIALISLFIGLLRKRDLLPPSALPAVFWISYLFSLFQAIPKSFLDISTESWRWLQIMVSPTGAAWGLTLYLLSWGTSLWGIWWIVSSALWGYAPAQIAILTAGSLGLVAGLSAFLAALARLSHAAANVLAMPLVLTPLLLALFREDSLMENLLYLAVALTLCWTLLTSLWES